MLTELSQFVLGQDEGEGIIELLIFGFLIVAGIIKSLFAAKQEQKRNQIQKKPSQRPTSQKAPATAEKIRKQRERYEQFLESILQPKKSAQKSQTQKPITLRPQPTGKAPVSNAKKTPHVTNVYTSQSSGKEPYRNIPPKAKRYGTENYIDKKSIEMTAMDTRIEQMSQFKEEHIQEDQQHLIDHDKPKRQRGKITHIESTDTIFTFSDSDDLKKAILYTEILGKPICLRETEMLYD